MIISGGALKISPRFYGGSTKVSKIAFEEPKESSEKYLRTFEGSPETSYFVVFHRQPTDFRGIGMGSAKVTTSPLCSHNQNRSKNSNAKLSLILAMPSAKKIKKIFLYIKKQIYSYLNDVSMYDAI